MRETRNTNPSNRRLSSEAGVTMVETLMAGLILIIVSFSMVGLIIASIATNNRNKIDSVQTMLAESMLEQINSTFNGTSVSTVRDCDGTSHTIDTVVANTASVGSRLSGSAIDFSEASPPSGYHMDYVVRTPCAAGNPLEGTFDVRWHLDQIGATNTYLITVSARLKDRGTGNREFALPVTLRFMSGS